MKSAWKPLRHTIVLAAPWLRRQAAPWWSPLRGTWTSLGRGQESKFHPVHRRIRRDAAKWRFHAAFDVRRPGFHSVSRLSNSPNPIDPLPSVQCFPFNDRAGLVEFYGAPFPELERTNLIVGLVSSTHSRNCYRRCFVSLSTLSSTLSLETSNRDSTMFSQEYFFTFRSLFEFSITLLNTPTNRLTNELPLQVCNRNSLLYI